MRSYSATLGRWLTPDPAGLAAVDPANPQSWNRYAYVLNNPASAIDPLGLDTHPCSGSTSNGLLHFCSQVNGNGLANNGLANAAQLGLDQMTLGGIGSPYDGYRGTATGGPAGASAFDFSGLPVVQKHDRVCYGKARVLRGNAHFLGRSGALGFIGYHAAAISYEQFGFRTSTQMERSGALGDVLGIVGIGPYGSDFAFTLSDVNGGNVHPGYPNVRAMLRARYPEQLIVELPGLPGTMGDPGTQPVMMLVPWKWNCPEGTHA